LKHFLSYPIDIIQRLRQGSRNLAVYEILRQDIKNLGGHPRSRIWNIGSDAPKCNMYESSVEAICNLSAGI
jgi:hypothetical protein